MYAKNIENFRFVVDRTSILQFAASLGDANLIYYDDAYAAQTPIGHVIAPPTFAIASAIWNPDAPFKGNTPLPPPKNGSNVHDVAGAAPSQLMGRLFHGEQHFEYHKPIRPGTVLSVATRRGKTWEKEGRRGGIMVFTEYVSEYYDEADELAVTMTVVGIETSESVGGDNAQ